MIGIRVVGPLDRNFPCLDGQLVADDPLALDRPPAPGLRGAFAYVRVTAGEARLLRDPLGIGKLFWASDERGELAVAARPRRLVSSGYRFEDVRAIAPGTDVRIDLESGASHVERDWAVPAAPLDANETLEERAARIRGILDAYCASLAAAHPSRNLFVCMSGGLDSTGIAVLARRHFANVAAVSFDLVRRDGSTSADRATAERLARDLELQFLEANCTEEELLEGIDTALVEGIDWRDFNVHAALINVTLARAIAASGADGALVLSGDLHNEYLVDYHAECYRGRTYYELPRLAPRALQRTLVRGLDTSHREVGVFQSFGLDIVQPYAAASDVYLALPDHFLADPARKERLCRLVFGDEIPEYVYRRPKTRAQVGDPQLGRGVLAVCIDRGIDAAWLRQRFAELHGVEDLRALDRFIRAGRYRAGVPEAPA